MPCPRPSPVGGVSDRRLRPSTLGLLICARRDCALSSMRIDIAPMMESGCSSSWPLMWRMQILAISGLIKGLAIARNLQMHVVNMVWDKVSRFWRIADG